jgi:hypothetical protein
MNSYTKVQFSLIETQLIAASAQLSDYDKRQNRARSADGKWAKSSSAMSDGEKLTVFLDKEQKIWKADTPERQAAIATIAQRLAGTNDTVAKVWGKVSGAETAYRDAALKKLAPAVALSGKDVKGIDIDERERAIADLDIELKKLLPESEANKLITELILDVSDYEYQEMAINAKDRTTESLENALKELSAPIEGWMSKEKEVVVQTFKNAVDKIVNGAIDAITQRNVSDEEFYEGSRKKVENEIKRKTAQAEKLEQLKRIGRNSQDFMDDVATATVVGLEVATKKIDTAGKELEEASQEVSEKVADFFKNNVEAYYEGRSKIGADKHKKVKAILDKAKIKVDTNPK